MDGFLIPPYDTVPVVSHQLSEIHHGIENNAYDWVREEELIIYHSSGVHNDTTVAQTV